MIYNPIEFIWKDVFVWEISDDQINGNHASVAEILQVTIVSVWSWGQRIHWHGNLSTHPRVRVSSVALLTGAGVVPRWVVTKGVCSTGVGLSTLVNVWRIKIMIKIANKYLYSSTWHHDIWLLKPEPGWKVRSVAHRVTHRAGEKAINLGSAGWWLVCPHYQMIYSIAALWLYSSTLYHSCSDISYVLLSPVPCTALHCQ